jgi:diguanylate cyclase (GGDEF)-like protein/hemerythrin-like metal-binding protein
MKSAEFDDDRIIKKFIKKYVIVLTFIFITLIIRQFVMEYLIHQDIYMSNNINISSKQRMLSQQISKDALALYLYTDNKNIQFYRDELETAINTWEKSSIELKSRKVNHKFIGKDSNKILKLYNDIEDNQQSILTAAKQIIHMIDSGKYSSRLLYDEISIIRENEVIYLLGMDNIVSQYDNEVVDKISDLSKIETILFIILVISILAQVILLLVPGQKKLSETYKNVLYLSYHDRLTGLYNRYYFDRKVNEEIDRAERYHEATSMIIMDLDFFKKVNDTWGHPIGDEVLKMTAETVDGIIRTTDVLARLGGEEFIVLLPNTTLFGAVTVAEKMRVAIEANCHQIAGKVTCSFGVVERASNESYSKWYKRVDEALYRAKEEGRNRVVSDDNTENYHLASVQLDWRSEWESGYKIIDDQHKEIVKIGNILIYESLSGSKIEKVMDTLELLLNHLFQHFESEQLILAEIGYSEFVLHKEKHEKLIAHALEIKESYQKGDLKPSAFFSYLVDEVIVGHMQEEDIKYFSYLKQVTSPSNETAS